MYHIRIAGELAFDALWDGSTVASASISQAANAAAYLDLTLAPSSGVSEGDDVTVDWDGDALFSGTVTEVTRGTDGTISASAVSGIDRLSGALVPPHSTDGSVGETCPGTRAAYVQWLAQLYNERSMGGYRVDVGENQADRLTTEPLAVSEPGWASVAQLLDDHVLSLGAHLEWEPREGGGTLSIWADLHEAADQLIDLGVNITDIHVTRTLEGRRTAVVPRCESDSGELTLSDPSEDAAAIVANAGLMLAGGAIYDPEAVAEWGWSEEAYEVGGAASDVDLARAGVPRLRTLMGPSVTVEVRAVDAALYDPSVGHLRMGQAARVRAESFGVDEYLAVQDVALDLMDPGQTSYTLGVAYDTLTGRQSAFLRQMNASIDHSLDLIGGVSGGLEQVAGDLVAVGDRADEALDKANEAVTGLGGVTEQVGDLGAEVAEIDAEVEQIRQDAEEMGAKVDKVASDAADALKQAQDTVDKVTADVAEAKEQAKAAEDAAADAKATADGYAQRIDDATATVNGVKQDVSALTTKVEGAVEDAAGALSAASKAQQDVTGFKSEVAQKYQPKGDYASSSDLKSYATKTEVEQTAGEIRQAAEAATETAQGALTQATQAVQTATGVKTTLETDYVSKDDASATYSTKAELSATSSKLTASITEAAKTAEAAQDKALEVEATASGLKTTITQVSSKADAAQKDADAAQSTADGAVKQVATLEATVDGVSSAVTKAQSTADSAVSAASKAQQTVDGFKTEVSQKYQPKGDYASKGDLAGYQPKGDYATKSSVEQTATQIKQQVADTYATKTALDQERTDRQSAITQSATQVKSEVSSTYLKKTDASSTYATKSSVTQTAESIKSEVAATYTTKTEFNGLEIGGRNLLLGTAYENLSHVTVRGGYGTVSMDTSDTVGSRTSLKLVTTQVGASVTRYIMHDLVPKLENKKVVVSFWVKGSVAASMMVRIGGGYTAGSTAMDKAVTTSWNRVVLEMGPLSGNGSSEPYVIIAFNKAGTFRVSGMKCEYGNRATDWSPAPEDMLSAADASATYATKTALTQTEDSITAEVSQKYQSKDGMSSYYTKTQVDTKVNSITTKVTETTKTADAALEKASQVEQTADGIQVTLTKGYHSASGTSATAGYIGIATIKIASPYANAPIYFELTSRNKKATPVWVRFVNSNSTDPALSSITADGDIKAYIRKTATSTWQLVVQKSESYDSISVTGFSKGGAYMEGKVAVTWTNVMLTSLPSGCTQATVLAGKRNGSEIDTAQSTADAAKTAAATAQTTATNAAKTATNFLKFDSAGLCVGNQTAGTLGYNALITSSAYQVRNGSTVLSSFGASTVELGRNSSTAQIKMCGGQGTIKYDASNGLSIIPASLKCYIGGTTYKNVVISSLTTNVGSTIAGSETNVFGTDISIGSSSMTSMTLGRGGTKLRGIYAGSKVLTISSTTWAFVRLFTNSEYAAIVGREYKTGDVVLVCNGDYQAYPAQIYAASYRGNETSWYVGIPTGRSGNVRVNYLIVAVA